MAGLVVLHYDANFERIAQVGGAEHEWVVAHQVDEPLSLITRSEPADSAEFPRHCALERSAVTNSQGRLDCDPQVDRARAAISAGDLMADGRL